MDFKDILTGKHVFVAGGTSGINLGIADRFAREGAKLSVISRKQDKVDAAAAQLSAHGVSAGGSACDVRDAEAVQAALADAVAARGPIDVLISGAAGNFPAPAVAMSSNAFKSVVDIDLIGTFNVLRHGFEHLNKPGASVINISAPQGTVPMMMQSHVCAAKAGVNMLTKSLAVEWGPAGVRVNAISPGPIEGTEGMERLMPSKEGMAKLAQSIPLQRNGSTEDIANAAVMLASPLASYITGAILPVDGGWEVSFASNAFQHLLNG